MKSLLFTAILSLRKRSEQILIKFAILLQVRLTHAQTFFRGVSSSSLEKSKTGYTGLETSKTGSTSPEMIASSSSAGPSGYEQSHNSVSGKKRRRTGARSSGKGKKKKSKTVMDMTGDNRELRDRLPQRVWDGTSYKVEVC